MTLAARSMILAALSGTATLALGTAQVPSGWTHQRLSQATYLILPPQIQGNQALISPEQRQGVLRAMHKDSGDALRRRYPEITLTQDQAASGAIRVTPILTSPAALVPWAKLNVSLTFDLPGGGQMVMRETTSLLTLVRQGPNAANYAFDQIARRLP
ncbi:hypothetical protein [Deinococcus koreensis]|uniref:hypothetical protein n=1 Tax=Deinococcus koreensis TaxID=2054903 RepID=UPI001FAEDCDA|nr:hypothetical protein [Deinococcus koreensis]